MNPIGFLVIAATALFPAYQLFTLPNVADKIALFSQYLGLAALILMAWGQVLSTRLRGIETVFGGMDRVYVLHKWVGIIAMAALLLHDTIDADMRGLGRETALNELAETLGEVSLYGLLILVVISVATFIPYHLWKWTHKAMGTMFAAGAFHFFFIMKPFVMSDPAGLYTGFFCAAGLAAYIWTLLPETLRPSYGYKIADLQTTGDALAITLSPTGKPLRPIPGQFGVLQFTGGGMAEPHPFSLSKIDESGSLRVTIKALGDFTGRLKQAAQIGQDVHVQGPFGRFRHTGKTPEIWVAGGIGVTPFLAWAHALEKSARQVELFYCVKSRNQAPHLAELEALAGAKANLNLHVIASSEGNRLSAKMISQIVQGNLSKIHVSFCGPVALREALRNGLAIYGVSARNFQYEEFEFRTGIGLKALAAWVLRRRES
jgi:predicted ferric reductase